MTCDDCICEGGSCAFLTSAEQPYFQAYRLAARIPIGAPWKGWEFSTWIMGRWRSWRAARGIKRSEVLSADQKAEFGAWLAT